MIDILLGLAAKLDPFLRRVAGARAAQPAADIRRDAANLLVGWALDRIALGGLRDHCRRGDQSHGASPCRILSASEQWLGFAQPLPLNGRAFWM